MNTGTNAAWIAASANRLRTRFGSWKAIVNADICPLAPKKLAATISRTSPAIRESPVAKAKKAVERASRPARGRGATTSSLGTTSIAATSSSSSRRGRGSGPSLISAPV